MRLCLSDFFRMCIYIYVLFFFFFFPPSVCQVIWLYSFGWHSVFSTSTYIFIFLMHAPFVYFRYSIPFSHCRDKMPNNMVSFYACTFFRFEASCWITKPNPNMNFNKIIPNLFNFFYSAQHFFSSRPQFNTFILLDENESIFQHKLNFIEFWLTFEFRDECCFSRRTIVCIKFQA